MRKFKKIFLYSILTIIILDTLYLLVIIYVLQVVSINSSHIVHSKTLNESKTDGYFAASYKLDKTSTNKNLKESLIPKELFIENEIVYYEFYYFYWGKYVKGNRKTMTGDIFLPLAESEEYNFVCSTASSPDQTDIISKYRKGIYFFFNETPSEIRFYFTSKKGKNITDTLIYKKA